MSKKSKVQQLRDQGFDRAEYLGNRTWRPRCSQCEVLVINGIACHETGCPNQRKEKNEEE